MAGKFTRLQKTYLMDDLTGVPMYTGVIQSGENRCKVPDDANLTPLGVVDSDERINDPIRAGGTQAGRQIAVKLEGIAEILLLGNINAGDRVILAAGGYALKIPNDAGTYEVLGFAEKDGENGDVIPVRMAYHVYTKEATPPTKYLVTFDISEEGATIAVKDSKSADVDAELDGTYLLEAGTYTYTVSKVGYENATGEVVVTNKAETITVTLTESV